MNLVLDTIEKAFFLVSVWDRRKEILYGNGSSCGIGQTNPTPECEVNGTECYGG